MKFEEYFEENFYVNGLGAILSKTPSTSDPRGYRGHFVDKDDLKDLWEVAQSEAIKEFIKAGNKET